ncbi:MAG: hypothetical protein AB7K52_06560 [Phycisphaerales bacterium]
MSSGELNDKLYRKARAYVQSLSTLTNKERENPPSAAMGHDYNRMRILAIELWPAFAQTAPPAVDIREGQGGECCVQSLAEISVFALQIEQYLRGKRAVTL